MANSISHLPHIRSTKAGVNKWDPMHDSIFEVYFTLPDGIASEFKEEEAILTEQVISVSGLNALNKTVQAGSQQFFGADASFLNPTFDNTYAELTVELNLNIRNVTDAFVLKVFKAWGKLGYDLTDGTRTLMSDYCADNLRIAIANRDGSVYRSIIFHKVLLTGITAQDNLDYKKNDAEKLQVTFRADYWEEELA